jgi:ariadne-1
MIDVNCTNCGKAFCFECVEDAHQPIDCETLQTWKTRSRKAASGEDSEAWLKNNTKNCPKCSAPIMKNSGCMHMDCRKCGTAFCWICMEITNRHDVVCKRMEEFMAKDRENASMTKAEESQREIARFDFYSTLYQENYKSLEFAKKRLTEYK